MADVSTVTELHTGAAINISEGKTTATRCFRVSFTAWASDNVHKALTASAGGVTIPLPYAVHPAYGTYSSGDPTVRSITVSQMEEASPVYLVTVDYSNEVENQRSERERDKSSSDYTADTNDIQISFSPYSRVMDKDIAGTAVLNSAGDPFDPPYEVEDYHLLLSITRSISPTAAAKAITYQNTVHNNATAATIAGFTINQYYGHVKDIRLQRCLRNATVYYEATFQIEIANSNSPGFRAAILDAGMSYINAGAKYRFQDGTGENMNPQKLNGSGAALAIDGTPVFLTYYPYPGANFATMITDFGLPAALT